MKINELFNLKDKVAIVTGGADGIGKATALLLADAGANIVIADLNMEKAEILCKEIEQIGVRALAVKCNILEDQSLVDLVDLTIKTFGTVNILINNAGGGGGGRENPFKITVDDIRRDYELNVFSAWRLSQLCVPHMKKSGYGGSKASVNHMVANLAFDFGPEVRINAVGPGATRTAALATVLTPEIEEKMLEHTPIKRLGTADDIAGAMLYLAAPISTWVSGQTIFVNGGGVQTLD